VKVGFTGSIVNTLGGVNDQIQRLTGLLTIPAFIVPIALFLHEFR
jgi:hypothetical protein